MYAVIQDRGHQYQVAPGARLSVDRMEVTEGDTVEMPVLLVSDDAGVKVGTPFVEGTKATLKVVKSLVKGDKVIAGTFKRRKDSRRRIGHRQQFSILEVVSIG